MIKQDADGYYDLYLADREAEAAIDDLAEHAHGDEIREELRSAFADGGEVRLNIEKFWDDCSPATRDWLREAELVDVDAAASVNASGGFIALIDILNPDRT